MTIILTGDIGGTHTRLELLNINTQLHTSIVAEKLLSTKFASLESAIAEFLIKHNLQVQDISSATFAVAGPVQNGKVILTNLPWEVSEKKLQDLLKTPQVSLMNDFMASAYGTKHLPKKDYITLQAGAPKNNSHRLLLGAGTGLGVALVYSTNHQYIVTATEGGHHDFAPINDEQVRLYQYLKKNLTRVSIERVLSGYGLINIYYYLTHTLFINHPEHPVLKQATAEKKLSAEIISNIAINHQDPIAIKTITIFIELYAQTAGNLALITLPYNGLFITGGIAPKLLQFFQQNYFLATFLNKGRMSNLLHAIPIYLVTNTNIGLTGAANYAIQKWHSSKEYTL